MKTFILGVYCGMMVTVAGVNTFASDSDAKPSPADSLRSASKVELPTRAAELVRLADPTARQATAIDAAKVAVELSPEATIEIVKSLCEATPQNAPAIAAAAARLQPGKVTAIGQTAAKAAPDKAAAIVLALCNQVPGQFRSIAAGVAKIVPSATRDILLSVAAAIPDLRAAIDRIIYMSAGVADFTVESAIAQAERANRPLVVDDKSPVVTESAAKSFFFPSPFGWYFPRVSFHRAPPQWFWWPHFRPPPHVPGPPPFVWFPWFPRPGPGDGHHGGGGHDYCAP